MGDEVNAGSRLWLLLAVHLIMGVAPVWMFQGSGSVAMLPVIWAIAALSLGQAMLLAFLVGMAPAGLAARIGGGLLGAAYLSLWQAMGETFGPGGSHQSFVASYLRTLPMMAGIVAIIAGMFLLIRLRGTTLRRLSPDELVGVSSKVRYSVHNLLLIMSVCAVVLALAKHLEQDVSATGLDGWQMAAEAALFLIIFPINTACAAWAALKPTGVLLRTAFVAIVALFLGAAMSLSAGQFGQAWWLWASGMLIPLLSTAVVYLSLLVVRSCGYRLVPRLPAG